MPADPRITLLGPQRNPRLDPALRRLGLRGKRIAVINAGWRDREDDDGLLVELLGGNCVNLRLWGLLQELWDVDPELDQADRDRRQVLTEMQELYVMGLQQAIEAIHKIAAHVPRHPEIIELAKQDALDILRDLDARHSTRVEELHLEFYERWEPHHRPAVGRARQLVGEKLAGCDAVVITGGHVGVLVGALHMFNLGPALGYGVVEEREDGTTSVSRRVHRPIVAWGAGAMALTEKVFLFHDFSVVAPGVSEVLMDGLGLTRGLVALPSAKERLDLKNLPSMRSLVHRCLPSVPLLLDEGAQVTLTQDCRVPAGAKIVGTDGRRTKHVIPGQPGPEDRPEEHDIPEDITEVTPEHTPAEVTP